MVKDKKYNRNYTYGSVAYDLEQETVEKEQKLKKSTSVKNGKDLKRKFKMIACVVVISSLSFLTLCRFAQIIKITNDISSIKTDIKTAQSRNEDIRVQMARFNNIRNIENAAVAKYGMVVPARQNVVYVDVKPLTASAEKPGTTAFQSIQRVLGLIN